MSRLRKSILGAALVTGLTAAVTAPAQPAAAAVVVRAGHWVHGWHGGHFGWWWAGPDFWYWYPAPVYYGYPPPPDYAVPASPQPAWYYCDSARGYYPYVPSCPGGWRIVPPDPQDRKADAHPTPETAKS